MQTELQLDGVAGARSRNQRSPLQQDGTEGFILSSSLGGTWQICWPKFLAEDLAASFLSPVGAAPCGSRQRTEAREKQNELLHKG